jgi:tRNA(Arg) A34 adenosine deaminase TadA
VAKDQLAHFELLSAGIDSAWQRALELAWDSFCANTTPVGAVVVNGSGAVVAEGRGRRYEQSGPPGQLASSHIAHAEVNALAQLRAGQDYEDHALITTLEPCGMCHGAAVQATVGSVLYAGPDPYGGTGALVFTTPQAQRRSLQVTGPLDDERGRLAALLHIVWLMFVPAGAHVLAAQRAGLAALTSLAERAVTRELIADAAASRASLSDLRGALRGMI